MANGDGTPLRYVPHYQRVPPVYAEHEATVEIESRELLEGSLPRRALSLVREWAEQHQAELEEDWELARERLPLNPIPPLP